MRRVFADSSYLIARFDRQDQWRSRSNDLAVKLEDAQLILTDGVIHEFLNHMSRRRNELRLDAVRSVIEWRNPGNDGFLVIGQTQDQLERGLALYQSRTDKSYSLTDCVSMIVMRDLNLSEVATFDSDFAQEGFLMLA